MSTDTTPGVDHAAAIREHAEACRLWGFAPHVDAILTHADTLDAARRDAEARAERIFRELIDMQGIAARRATPKDREDMQRVWDRASAVLNGTESPDSDLDAEPAPPRADGGA